MSNNPQPARPARSMTLWLATLTALLTLIGLALTAVWSAAAPAGNAAPRANTPPPGFKLTGDIAKGRQVYAINCAVCHGDAGDGKGEGASVLNPRPTDLTDGARMAKVSDWDLYRVIRDGGPALGLSEGMQAFKPLVQDADLRNAAVFVRTLAKGRRPAHP